MVRGLPQACEPRNLRERFPCGRSVAEGVALGKSYPRQSHTLIQGNPGEVRLAMSSADRKGTIGTSAYWLCSWPRRYGLALIAVAVATLTRYALSKWLGANAPFILFYPIVWV